VAGLSAVSATADPEAPALDCAPRRPVTLKIGRSVKVDVGRTPMLVWEWKPLALPTGGNLRNPKRSKSSVLFGPVRFEAH
jgi:hypothetical protein